MRVTIFMMTVLGLATCTSAYAWGPDGHQTVGALAAKLIAGTEAERHVEALLHGVTLSQAAVWADCVKGVSEATFEYRTRGRYPECKVFETPAGEAAMIDFVRRNARNCERKPGEESCHRQYHYTDASIREPRYRFGAPGTRDDDVVAAISAAVRLLKGEALPEPFKLRGQREALMLLAHYVGDIHQPLHVGALYLNSQGRRVNPNANGFNPANSTRGGNELKVGSNSLHHMWDAIPSSLKPCHVNAEWVAKARALPRTPGSVDDWPAEWADSSLLLARQAFRGVKPGAQEHRAWPITLPRGYKDRMAHVKEQQLTAAGAHLAQVLLAIWPPDSTLTRS